MLALVPLLAALAQPLPAAAPHAVLAEEVAAAERAFDAHTQEVGFTAGFTAFAAPDGILFRPDPVNAREHLASGPASDDRSLRWWPARIGVAASGDLAFDAGPWTVNDGAANGWFFTIWKRQPDGRWLWVLDHGSGTLPGPSEIRPGDPIRPAAAASRRAASPAAAWTEVLAAEAGLAAAVAAEGAVRAYRPRLAGDAWVATPDLGPATEPAAIAVALDARPQGIAFEVPAGGEASQAGDFAYAYGHARWREGGTDRRGHYVRVWRNDADGWRVVYDQLTSVPAGG